ncbi:hypothetical protein [Okeania sp. SIO2C9]|uniref:hypothetical protein n=1 Tax=Okeania sp. SIO2C9 TaxID=2607791 RepID=UPI0025F96F21|nr:hypothetical protein [Okeania sp. SIO2C9]
MGRGRVQSTAIDELEALPADNLFRSNALLLLADLLSNIEVNQNLESEDRELIMRLSPLFSQRLEEATKQGMREERREQIENILKVRFGTIDNQLEAIIEPSLSLLPAELVPLLLQLSRDELLARFVGQNGTQN